MAGVKSDRVSFRSFAREVLNKRPEISGFSQILERLGDWRPNGSRSKRRSAKDVAPENHWHPHFGRIGGLTLAAWLESLPPPPPIRLSLIVTGEERTGSEWLCQLMAATGRLGRPSEFFNPAWFQKFIPDYPNDIAGEIRVIQRAGVSANGILAVKLHPWHFDRIIKGKGKLTDAVPNPMFIRLSRRDHLGQAISLMRAHQTDRYHQYWKSDRPEHYNARELEKTLNGLISASSRWTRYFARNGIEPLQIYYEDFAADPIGTVRRIGDAAGVNIGDFSIERELKPQRDGISADWRQRFLKDVADLNRFD